MSMAGNPIALDTSVVVKHLRGLAPLISLR